MISKIDFREAGRQTVSMYCLIAEGKGFSVTAFSEAEIERVTASRLRQGFSGLVRGLGAWMRVGLDDYACAAI